MRNLAINRRFLYAGLFLVALGGVVVAVDLAGLDTSFIAGALRLWPLALIAIGFGIALRRSRFALVAGIVGALVPGLVFGGGLTIAPRHAIDCGRGESPSEATQHGAFTGPATVSVAVNCGSIAVSTRPGPGWALTSTSTAGHAPAIDATGQFLGIRSTGREDVDWFDSHKDAWNLTLPTTELTDMGVTLNAGRATLALDGATVGRLDLVGSAAEVVLDLRGSSIEQLDATINLGRLVVELPDGGVSGEIHIGGGELQLCSPPGLGLRVELAGSANEVRVNGLEVNGRVWQNQDVLAADRADLSLRVNFGTVDINPIGGCK